MSPTKVGAAPVRAGTTPVPAPGTPIKKPKAFPYRSTETPFANATGSRNEPRRPRFTISDAAAWAIATLIVGTVLIVACVLLTLGLPS